MAFLQSLPLWVQTAIQLFAALAFLVGLVVGLVHLVRWLFTKKQGYPYELEVEAALKPYAINGILAAYKASEAKVDEVGERLHGIDKLALAQKVYALLPDEIPVYIPAPGGGITVTLSLAWLKTVFTEENFAALVQSAFDEFMEFLKDNQDRLGSEVDELLAEIG